jgi:hypothetical protein
MSFSVGCVSRLGAVAINTTTHYHGGSGEEACMEGTAARVACVHVRWQYEGCMDRPLG